jgi:thiol:disulfide interchange protein DsbC
MLATHSRKLARSMVAAGLAIIGLGAVAAWTQAAPTTPAPAAAAASTTAAPAAATAAGASQPLTGEAAKLKKLLEEKFEGATIGSISKSPYFGLYEVLFDDQIVYTDAKATHVFVGSVYDANTKKNLTEARKRQLSRVSFDSLPLELAFKRVKGNGARKLAIFSTRSSIRSTRSTRMRRASRASSGVRPTA